MEELLLFINRMRERIMYNRLLDTTMAGSYMHVDQLVLQL